MKYSQSVCAQNLLTSLATFDKLVKAGMTHMHLDFMDFHVTPSFGLNLETGRFLKQRYPNVTFDAHLMVAHPYDIIGYLDFVDYIFVAAKQYDAQITNPKISIFLEKDDQVDHYQQLIQTKMTMLVMTINKLGGIGEQYNPHLLKKVKHIKKLNRQITIFADGGLRLFNYQEFQDHGVDVAIGGSIINSLQTNNFINLFKEGANA